MRIPCVAALLAASGCAEPARPVLHPIDDRPIVAITDAGDPIVLGGFSGLAFLGVDESTGTLRFMTHTDRGPNAEMLAADGGRATRPFALPRFQPELVMLEVDGRTGKARIVRRIGLVAHDGAMLTGLPPAAADAARDDSAKTEVATDLHGGALVPDPLGVDLEGLAHGDDGSWWLCDEYQPSILRFNDVGQLMERWVPERIPASPREEVGASVDLPAIPSVYARRVANHGFEGIALAGNRLHAFPQGPLATPGVTGATLKRSRVVRVPVFDVEARTLVAEHIYLLESPKHKIGDATAAPDGEILVLETGGDAPGGAGVAANVFRVDERDATEATSGTNATNLLTFDRGALAALEPLEARTPKELRAAGIVPLRKTLVLDCAASGYDFASKPEGLAVIDQARLAIINDDDFGLAGTFDARTGRLTPNPSPQPVAIAVFRVNLVP